MTDTQDGQTVLWPEMGPSKEEKVKAEITITYKFVYELDPAEYAKELTPEEMLEAEIESVRKYPDIIIENSDCEPIVNGRIIGATAP